MDEKDVVRKALLTQLDAGKLITPKHDETSLGTPVNKPRTVVTQPDNNIRETLQKDQFKMFKYENNNPAHSKDLYQLVPYDSSIVPASGVPAFSKDPTYACDSWVAVSGHNQSWHMFGDNDANLKNNPNLKFLGPI